MQKQQHLQCRNPSQRRGQPLTNPANIGLMVPGAELESHASGNTAGTALMTKPLGVGFVVDVIMSRTAAN